jgi:hypothetical protein
MGIGGYNCRLDPRISPSLLYSSFSLSTFTTSQAFQTPSTHLPKTKTYPFTMMFSSSLLTVLLTALLLSLTSITQAWTIGIGGLGTPPPPAVLVTTDISPQCTGTNNGTYLCCAATFDGGNPIVATAAAVAGYQLPANTVNGIVCE